ncbi:MAG: hypothetical protein A2Z88_02740 [Omnitrophica WOR_2 bacterium GWA2_47_8]|nr:MAG: hypothetical protein A2Z88_02740 [Omnitrophica WOR_2 bacterium GWA2_47_8]
MPKDKITSLTNPFIKELVKLRDRKTRKESNFTLVEGFKETGLALESKAKFEQIFLCPELFGEDKKGRKAKVLEEITKRKLPTIETTKEVFQKISYGERQEGILGLVEPYLYRFADLKLKKDPLFVVAECVEKPGNLGAILRTSEAANADALIVVEAVTDIFNPNVIRASLGTVFTIPVVSCSNQEAFDFLKKQKVSVCIAEPNFPTIYYDADLKQPVALVVGGEKEGLSQFWRSHADVQVKVPMFGKAGSLNLSVTAGVLIYEAVRQRNELIT